MTTNGKKIRLCLWSALRCTTCSGSIRSLAVIISRGLCLGLLAVGCAHHQVAVTDNAAQLSNPSRSSSGHEVGAALPTIETQPAVAPHPKRANFEREHKSRDAQHVADWVVDSGDNRGMPFVIVDKIDAKVFVLDADGRLRGAAPALLGLARGDDSIPGIGDRKLSDVRPEERTTPAELFNNVVSPAFSGTYGVVYVLPETRSKSEIFASYYDVERRYGTGTTADLDKGTGVGRHTTLDLKENGKGAWKNIYYRTQFRAFPM